MKALDQIEGANGSSLGIEEFDDGMSPDLTAKALHRNRHDLTPILAVIRREMDQSAGILRDLAECLSRELCTLGTAKDEGALRSSLLAATIALQNEDRIQQRLCDLSEVLSLLERMLAQDAPTAGVDLNQEIIESLRLEEMRYAFALGMDSALPPSSGPAEPPSIGDVDLF